ncbi:hypothetical protein BJY01DRAFT_59703 [Aspergillus pseudoustus]|uniref:Uncharacterized protein n=1 Tax=Aspergillus pseudoustus TaxID=1810923 RepID=A0ABR4J884_9EURO
MQSCAVHSSGAAGDSRYPSRGPFISGISLSHFLLFAQLESSIARGSWKKSSSCFARNAPDSIPIAFVRELHRKTPRPYNAASTTNDPYDRPTSLSLSSQQRTELSKPGSAVPPRRALRASPQPHTHTLDAAIAEAHLLSDYAQAALQSTSKWRAWAWRFCVAIDPKRTPLVENSAVFYPPFKCLDVGLENSSQLAASHAILTCVLSLSVKVSPPAIGGLRIHKRKPKR